MENTKILNGEQVDTVIGKVRETGTPCNRTSLRALAVSYLVGAYTDEDGNTDIDALGVYVKAHRITKATKVIGKIAL